MIEKVNPSHPDKVADRIAGAIVDLAYQVDENPKIAVEVLIGHGKCHAIIETTTDLNVNKIKNAIKRIAGKIKCDIVIVPQDKHLSENQSKGPAVITVSLRECLLQKSSKNCLLLHVIFIASTLMTGNIS